MFGLNRRRQPPSVALHGHLLDPCQFKRETRTNDQAAIRALCHSSFVGEATALCRVLGRFKMFVDTADRGHAPHLMLDGYWEMWVTEAMIETVKPGMNAIDIGANLGYFTLLLAHLVGSKGSVHAFEPNVRIARRLRDTLSVNGLSARVSLHEKALSRTNDETAVLVIPPGEPKNAHVVRGAGLPHSLPVTTRRLDAIEGLPPPDFIKIDADTAEEDIWYGMSGILEQQKPLTIFLEFAAARYADPGSFIDDMVARGFSLAYVDFQSGVRPIRKSAILESSPYEDRMLVLCRK